jgi:thiol:disulfide interchange protein
MAAIVTIAVVLAILAVVAYGLFEISPFARHRDRFHEPGKRQQSPRLD